MTISSQKPLSSVTESTLAPTATNFPALKHFFKCDEDRDATTWTDSVGGVVHTPDSISQVAGKEGKALDIVEAASTALTSGAWAEPGGKSMVIFYLGTALGLADLEIGGAAGATGLSFAGGQAANNHVEIREGANAKESATTGFTQAAVNNMRGVTVDFSGNLTMFEYESDGTWTASVNTIDLTAVTAITDMTSWSDTLLCNLFECHGFAILHFNTLPNDLAAAIPWMYNEWVNGNKVIWPGWKDRT